MAARGSVCVCGVCAGAQDIKHTEHVCPWGRELVYSPLRRAHVAGPTIGQGTRAPAVAARVSTHIVPTAWECWVALVPKCTAEQLGVGGNGGDEGILVTGSKQNTLPRHPPPQLRTVTTPPPRPLHSMLQIPPTFRMCDVKWTMLVQIKTAQMRAGVAEGQNPFTPTAPHHTHTHFIRGCAIFCQQQESQKQHTHPARTARRCTTTLDGWLVTSPAHPRWRTR